MPEKHLSPENNDSGNERKIAEGKLERLLEKGFSDFGVRFVNEGEYWQMIEQGKPFAGMETIDGEYVAPKKDKTFRGLLEDIPADWTGLADAYLIGQWTNWTRGCEDMKRGGSDRCILKRRHTDVLEKGAKNIRTRTLKLFMDGMRQDNANEYREEKDPAIEALMQQSDLSKSELRTLLNARSRRALDERNEDEGAYHIMIVLDRSAIDQSQISWGRKQWKFIKQNAGPETVMAAFSLLPLKNLYLDMIEKSSHAGKMAHPIFDNYGAIHWPKLKSLNGVDLEWNSKRKMQ